MPKTSPKQREKGIAWMLRHNWPARKIAKRFACTLEEIEDVRERHGLKERVRP